MNRDLRTLTVPLFGTPAVFRVYLSAATATAVLGFWLILAFAPGPRLGALVHDPRFLVVVGLIVLADLYPRLPWMSEVRPTGMFIWSAALGVGAVMALGPAAAVVFPLSGLGAALSRERQRWWRALLQTATFAVLGLVAATLVILLPAGPGPHHVTWLLGVALAMAVALQCTNFLMIGGALVALGLSRWRLERAKFAPSVMSWGINLIAGPLIASLIQTSPVITGVLAVPIITMHHALGLLSHRTAQARTDPLTGLANRTELLSVLEDRLAAVGDSGHGLTVLLIDLDGFKQVNDSYGHPMGDAVLVEVAARLRAVARSSDLVVRYGGDEFAMLLDTGAQPIDVRAVTRRIVRSLAQPVEIGTVGVSVGASVGSATSYSGVAPDALVAQADADMYRQKADRSLASALARPAALTSRLPVWSVAVQGTVSDSARPWTALADELTARVDGESPR